jgi:beta-mannosidase
MDVIDLNGTWGLGWDDSMRKISARPMLDVDDGPFLVQATVPGEVHLDLMKAGIIGDPNLGLGTVGARWVDDTMWWYHRDFDLTAKQAKQRTWLCFDQLDLVARIYLNGTLVGQHCNAFRPYRVEVTEHLREGANHIAVEIEAWLGGIDKNAVLVDRVADWNRHKRPYNRKPSYQWGWDWSSRYLNVGIEGNAYLLIPGGDLIVDRAVPLVEVSPDLATATVRARVEFENVGTEPVTAKLRARVAGVDGEAAVEVPVGASVQEVVLTVPNPELWWPNGHGSQTLHDLEIDISADGVDEHRTARVGFRRIDIDHSAHPERGDYFIVVVNNRRIFCKGGNTAPLDTIPNRTDRARYQGLIARALEENFNFLRVNGVGLYESDDFYELCDEAGILVWQDMTFSCTWYPADDQEFLDDINAELIHQVRRIASHPSLAIWCGQNESEWLYRKPDNSPSVLPDYAIFHLLIPVVLDSNDPYTYYAPCSPHSPDSVAFPNDDFYGDQHPWHVGMGNHDIRDYRDSPARFSSEGGILGPGSLLTLKEIIEDHDHPLQSVGWHTRDNSIAVPTVDRMVRGVRRSAVPNYMVRFLFGKEPAEMNLEEYVYWGGLAQSEGLREYIENYRRRWPDSAAAIYWAFNDSWPTTRSWTTVDYYQRRTPGFWAVRRTMAPVGVVVAPVDGEVVVFGVNDSPHDATGELESGFFGTHGGVTSEKSTVTLPANTSTPLRNLGKWSGDPSSSIAFAVLRREGAVDARSRLIEPLYTEVDWAPAGKPTVTVKDGVATFESDVFVFGVCIDLDGDKALHDNMFDLYPGQPYSIPWPFTDAPKILFTGNLAD